MRNERETQEKVSPDHAEAVCQTLARYGRLSRQRLLARLYDKLMLSFDLDRALPRLRGKVKTEVENGVTFYELR